MTIPSESGAQHMGLFWLLRLDRALPAAPEPRFPATMQRAGPELVGELAAAMGLDDPAPVLQRFQQGRQCHIARSEGRIASCGWITFDEERIGELGLRVRLLSNEAYIWDCFTLPAYRGQHLYPALLAHMLRELRAGGCKRVWIGMDADNLPSQAGVARAGFQPIVDLLQVRHASTRTFLTRGYPDASEQDVRDAQYALFGDSEMSSITLAY